MGGLDVRRRLLYCWRRRLAGDAGDFGSSHHHTNKSEIYAKKTVASVVASWLLPPMSGEGWDRDVAARGDAPIPARCIDRPVTIRSKFDSPVILKVWLFYPYEQVPQSISWPIDFTFCLRPKTDAGLELLNRGADQPGGA